MSHKNLTLHILVSRKCSLSSVLNDKLGFIHYRTLNNCVNVNATEVLLIVEPRPTSFVEI